MLALTEPTLSTLTRTRELSFSARANIIKSRKRKPQNFLNTQIARPGMTNFQLSVRRKWNREQKEKSLHSRQPDGGPIYELTVGWGWILTTHSSKSGFKIFFKIVTAAAFRPESKYTSSFLKRCMETLLRVEFHTSNCSSFREVPLNSYVR